MPEVHDTEAHILPAFQMLQLKYALKLEIKSGLKLSRGSPMAFINRTYGTKFTRKRQALNHIELLLERRTDTPPSE